MKNVVLLNITVATYNNTVADSVEYKYPNCYFIYTIFTLVERQAVLL